MYTRELFSSNIWVTSVMFLVLGPGLLRIYHIFAVIPFSSGSASRPLDLQCSHHCLRKGWTLAAVNCVVVKDAEGGARGRRCSIQCSDQQLCHIWRMAAGIRMSGSNASWPWIMERLQIQFFFKCLLSFNLVLPNFCYESFQQQMRWDFMSERNSGFLAWHERRTVSIWHYLAKNRDFQLTLTQVRRIGLYTSLEISGGYHKYHPADGTGTSW